MDIILRKIDTKVIPNKVYTYHIKNLDNLTMNLDMPLSNFALPLQSDEQAVLVKIQGNTMNLTISWTVRPTESTSLVDETVTGYGSGIITDQDNLRFLTKEFATKDITDKFHLYLANTDHNGGFTPPLTVSQADIAFTNSVVFKKKGILQKVSFTRNAGTPVTYNVTIDFAVGTVVVVDELNLVT